jgi:hypothetical protein
LVFILEGISYFRKYKTVIITLLKSVTEQIYLKVSQLIPYHLFTEYFAYAKRFAVSFEFPLYLKPGKYHILQNRLRNDFRTDKMKPYDLLVKKPIQATGYACHRLETVSYSFKSVSEEPDELNLCVCFYRGSEPSVGVLIFARRKGFCFFY